MKIITYNVIEILFERNATKKELKNWFDSTPDYKIKVRYLKENRISLFTVSKEQLNKLLLLKDDLVVLNKIKLTKKEQEEYKELVPKYYLKFTGYHSEHGKKFFDCYLNEEEYRNLKNYSFYNEITV